MKIPFIAQIAVLTSIIIIGVVLLIAMSGKPASMPINMPASGEVSLAEAETIEEPAETEAGKEMPEAVIGDAEYTAFEGVIAEGIIVDSITGQPLAGLEVKTYCDAKTGELFIGRSFTAEDGYFKINAQDIYDACKYGKHAWFEVEYNGNTYPSPKIDIPEKQIRSGGSSYGGRTTLLEQTSTAHMPEFSTVTLALAILGSGLVLAFFRKK